MFISVIYCDEVCIKDKSDIPCIFTFIYRAVQKACLFIEVLRRKMENLSFYLWSDVIEEFHSRGITCYDYILSPHLVFFEVSYQNNRIQLSVYWSIFCGGFPVQADHCSCPA